MTLQDISVAGADHDTRACEQGNGERERLLGHREAQDTSCSVYTATTASHEVKVYSGYIARMLLNQLVQRYVSIVGPIAAMAKYGSAELAGAALADTTYNILAVAPTYGIVSALDTLGSQAYGGQTAGVVRDLNMLYTLRVLLVNIICMAFVIPAMYLIEPVFLALGIESEPAEVAATFLRCSAFGIPGFAGYECLRKYAAAQGRNSGPMLAVLAAAPIPLWILHTSCFGRGSAPLALAFFFDLMFFCECVWAYFALPPEVWRDIPSFAVIRQGLGIVWELAGAGLISVCSDWYAWEYLTVASAWLGGQHLAANSICITAMHFVFFLPAALMNASSVRVSHYLGRNEPLNAKTAAHTAVVMGATITCCVAVLVVLMGDLWLAMFTSDPEVIAVASEVWPWFFVVIALDAAQGMLGGIIRGAGRPMDIYVVRLSSHYLCGLPLATFLAFSRLGMGLRGLWLGQCLGLTIITARELWIIFTNDWEEGNHLEISQEHITSFSQSHEQS